MNNTKYENEIYGRVLGFLSRTALVLLPVSLVIFYGGLASGRVPLAAWPELWSLSAAELKIRLAGETLLNGEGLVLWSFGLMLLAPLLGNLALLPAFWRRKNRLYAALALGQVSLLILAWVIN